jgi:hypothetical protein
MAQFKEKKKSPPIFQFVAGKHRTFLRAILAKVTVTVGED